MKIWVVWPEASSCLHINKFIESILRPNSHGGQHEFHTTVSDEFQGLSGSILICTVDSILAFRVWILYEKSQKILWFLIVIISAIGPKTPGCWPQLGTLAYAGAHLLSFYYCIPPVITSFIMLLMTLYRYLFWNHMKTPIFSLFLRDGVFWFLAVLLVIIPEIVTGALTRDSRALSGLMIIPTLAVFSLIGSRVMLNIKMFVADAEVSGTINMRGTFGDRITEFKAATRDIGSTTADIEISIFNLEARK
ncbi:hypothetical protein BD779DRAFT_1471908 [Infundibulicybe gibba]|nr:hypothetical protein BD779DRAFT_1471908 [Infundibulicybe gibba]